MGARIRELRERSPWKQHHMAEKIGVGLRMWQRIEQRGTTEWERVEQIAEIHDVDPHWIWSGEEKPATPDLMRQLNGSSSEQLDRIEGMLQRLLNAAGLETDEVTEAAEEVALADVPEPQSQSETTPRRRDVAERRRAAS